LNIFFIVLIFFFLTSGAFALEKDFTSKDDIKFGPIIRVSYPYLNNENIQFAIPPLSLNIYGESFFNGTTGLIIEWFNYNKIFKNFEAGKTYFYEVKPNNSTKVNKNLLLVSFKSPISFKSENDFEFGWFGGIIAQFVNLEQQFSGDTSPNIGVNFGSYFKTYNFYPFVPNIDLRLLLGNFYDNGRSFQEKKLSTSIKLGYIGNIGLDYFINRRIYVNLSYSILNPEFIYFSPTKSNSNNEPLDDPTFNNIEYFNTINASIGFFF